mgnify:CR=1 FL=1
MQLQQLAGNLGIVTRMDLAQATDLAEVLGLTSALNLLFGIPIMGEFANAKWNTFLRYTVAVILTILNFKLIIDLF